MKFILNTKSDLLPFSFFIRLVKSYNDYDTVFFLHFKVVLEPLWQIFNDFAIFKDCVWPQRIKDILRFLKFYEKIQTLKYTKIYFLNFFSGNKNGHCLWNHKRTGSFFNAHGLFMCAKNVTYLKKEWSWKIVFSKIKVFKKVIKFKNEILDKRWEEYCIWSTKSSSFDLLRFNFFCSYFFQ